ncbi:DUF6205 family protein [Streptosporangium sp. NPDC002524]|uniref:DUF6205 family protein n=1 Tax=Streptosporangium sp. NPDC002524 TaxID=3154537 RepID=UPI00331E4806
MSYHFRLTGELAINPPIPLADIPPTSTNLFHNQAFYVERYNMPLAHLAYEIEKIDGADVATSLRPVMKFPYKLVALTRELEEILAAHGTGRTFTGELEQLGEEPGHVITITVMDGQVVEEEEEADDDQEGAEEGEDK